MPDEVPSPQLSQSPQSPVLQSPPPQYPVEQLLHPALRVLWWRHPVDPTNRTANSPIPRSRDTIACVNRRWGSSRRAIAESFGCAMPHRRCDCGYFDCAGIFQFRFLSEPEPDPPCCWFRTFTPCRCTQSARPDQTKQNRGDKVTADYPTFLAQRPATGLLCQCFPSWFVNGAQSVVELHCRRVAALPARNGVSCRLALR
jgi:hypothetical protein